MHSPVRIAVDVMGGDQGSRSAVLAAYKFLQATPSLSLTLVGDTSLIQSYLPSSSERLILKSTDQVVSMTDRPAAALRQKMHSSMAMAVDLVATNTVDACVSGGNTGALMAFGLKMLGTIDGIDRPAICKAVPTARGRCLVLDLGANITCAAHNLEQFALLGVAMAEAAGVVKPRVGLLNVGSEANKGGALQREAMNLLQATDINLIGNVEGDDIYTGCVDVIVCDGFTGNVVLKASEGAAEFMLSSLKSYLMGPLGWLLRRRLKRWRAQFSPENYNGAALLGLNGVVVKSHGASSELGFGAALRVAFEQVSSKSLASIQTSLQKKN